MKPFKTGDKVRFQVVADTNDMPRWSYSEDRSLIRSADLEWRDGIVTASNDKHVAVTHGRRIRWLWPNMTSDRPGWIRKQDNE